MRKQAQERIRSSARTLSVVIPAYNEQDEIARGFSKVKVIVFEKNRAGAAHSDHCCGVETVASPGPHAMRCGAGLAPGTSAHTNRFSG